MSGSIPPILIPDSLARSVQRGEGVLWAGAGIGTLGQRPSWHEILRGCLSDLPEEVAAPLQELVEQGRLATVLSWIYRHHGDARLTRELDRFANQYGNFAGSAAPMLARLPWRAALSTVHTELVWQAMRASNPTIDVLSVHDAHEITLRGDFPPFVMRTPPRSRAMRADRAFFELIEEIIKTQTMVYVGFDPDDPDLAQILPLLDRIGRGRRHYALMPFVSEAEAEELLDRYGIEVVHVPQGCGLGEQIVALAAAVATVTPVPADPTTVHAHLDLQRMLARVDVRADYGIDEAVCIDPVALRSAIAALPQGEVTSLQDPPTMLKVGVTLLAHGDVKAAKQVFLHIVTRGTGAEFQSTTRFNLALCAATEGDADAATSGLREAAEAMRSLAVVPPRLDIRTVHARYLSTLELGCVDREGGANVDVTVTTLGRRATYSEQQVFVGKIHALKELNHPAIMRVRGAYADAHLFAVMVEPLPGFTLEEVLGARDGEPMTLEQAFEAVGPIVEGLVHAHRKELVHGAIRPSLVSLTASGPVLRGYSSPPAASLSRPSWYRAAIPWMAPEVAAGGAPSSASDVYAIASILCQCLTLEDGHSGLATLQLSRALTEPILLGLIGRALSADARRRPSLNELRSRLAELIVRPEVSSARHG